MRLPLRMSVMLVFATSLLFLMHALMTLSNSAIRLTNNDVTRPTITATDNSLLSEPRNTSSLHDHCQAVHIVVACTGPANGRQMVDMMKTLLHSRTSPLVFHFVTSQLGHDVITGLMNTWDLPGVQYYTHTEDMFNPRTSEFNTLLILLKNMDKYLPPDLNKVVILSGYMRLLQDISHLWKEIEKFTDKQVIGMTNGFSRRTVKRYYFDVVALRLDQFKSSPLAASIKNDDTKNWGEMFSIIQKHQDNVYHLPCEWSLRLDSDFKLDSCLQDSNKPMAIWWGHDAYFTGGLLEPYIDYIRTVVTSDPNLLHHTSPSACYNHNITVNVTPSKTAACSEYRYMVQLKKLTHYFFSGVIDKQHVSENDVTVMTVFTMSRFKVLEKLLSSWQGPAVAVLYGDAGDARILVTSMKKSKVLNTRKNLVIHVVYKREPYFPLNYLRNVAIRYSGTEYAFYVDVDLVPNDQAYSYIKQVLANSTYNEKVALVVPCFESLETLPYFPNNRSQMVQLMDKDIVDGYSMRRGWNLGHKPTNFLKWKTANAPYDAKFADAFEPYTVLRHKDMPYFKELLFERMGDKIAYSLYLHHTGFTFKVLLEAFTIHLPHAKGDTNYWPQSSSHFRCGAVLIGEYKEELKQKYPLS